MTTTNGWPDPARPGVPINPEKDGWHWLLAPDGEQFPCLWSVIGVSQRGRFPMGWIFDPESWSPEECTYLGPVLTPDEASALQKRADQAALGHAREAARADQSEFLHKRDVAALQKRVAELEKALITAQNMLSEMGISSAEKCQMAYDYLREANAALGGKDEPSRN